jgi:hypothetical protein
MGCGWQRHPEQNGGDKACQFPVNLRHCEHPGSGRDRHLFYVFSKMEESPMTKTSCFSHFYLDGEAAFMAGEPFDPGRFLMPDEAAEWRAGWAAASQAAVMNEAYRPAIFGDSGPTAA